MLIIDEALEVVKIFNDIRKDDITILLESGCVEIDEDGFINWKEDKAGLDTKYNTVKNLALTHSLIIIDNKVYLWQYPPEIFRSFKEVYILTYLFEASPLSAYCKLYNIPYKKYGIDKDHQICEWRPQDTSKYTELITIENGKQLNQVGDSPTALSVSWFNKSYNKDKITLLKNACYNFFSNKRRAKVNTIMWTTKKEIRNKIKGKGYSREDCFVSCNCRATNKYGDRFNLAYILNIYMNPEVKKFFNTRGVEIDQDLYALSELLQWIWRSRIRNNLPVYLYLPSSRMRGILMTWLKGAAA